MNDRIEHANVRPEAKSEDIRRHCEEAITHRFRGVCVTPWHIQLTANILEGSPVLPMVVIGFPFGCMPLELAGYETMYAVDHGAKEVEVVLNAGAIMAGDDNVAGALVGEVVRLAHNGGARAKVILESWRYSDTRDLRRACKVAVNHGADVLKTSTGFYGSQCAVTPHQVSFLRRNAPEETLIQASGGIRTKADAMALIEAGAHTLGTSRGVALVAP